MVRWRGRHRLYRQWYKVSPSAFKPWHNGWPSRPLHWAKPLIYKAWQALARPLLYA